MERVFGTARWHGIALVWVVGGIASTAIAGDGPAPFTEEAIERGIDFTPDQTQSWGDGLAVADLDGDGDPDIVAMGRADGLVGVYENNGDGYFTDRSLTSGIDLLPTSSGIAAGDYDADGDLDLYISRWLADVMLRNDGDFQFTDVTAEAGLGDTGEGAGVAWADFDGDGWLDVYVTTHKSAEPNRLYRNQGDGTFVDVAALLGVAATDQRSFQPAFFDMDRDGDADLYLANSYGQHCATLPFHNLLFENVGGVFVDITFEADAAACVDSMCIGVGDFDNDLRQDLYVTDNNQPGNALLMSKGFSEETQTWQFEDEADITGTESFATAWGSVFFDYDNDGRQELYVCNTAQPNRLYAHGGVFPCVDMARALAVDITGGAPRTCATADVDADGDLDLLVSGRNAPVRLFVNHEGETRHWVKFDVVGEGRLRHAIGANVEVRAGGARQLREVIAGCNYKAQNELVVHFGLGNATTMNVVEVMWPGGTTRTLSGYGSNDVWTVYPPGKLGDADQDGDRDLDDFTAMVACRTADPGAIVPGCETMDLDGDADVDTADLTLFLEGYEGNLLDCNANGVTDLVEIFGGTAPDEDANGIIDTCVAIPADLNFDFVVDVADLNLLLAAWGETGSPADLDANGVVGFTDLVLLLSHWS